MTLNHTLFTNFLLHQSLHKPHICSLINSLFTQQKKNHHTTPNYSCIVNCACKISFPLYTALHPSRTCITFNRSAHASQFRVHLVICFCTLPHNSAPSATAAAHLNLARCIKKRCSQIEAISFPEQHNNSWYSPFLLRLLRAVFNWNITLNAPITNILQLHKRRVAVIVVVIVAASTHAQHKKKIASNACDLHHQTTPFQMPISTLSLPFAYEANMTGAKTKETARAKRATTITTTTLAWYCQLPKSNKHYPTVGACAYRESFFFSRYIRVYSKDAHTLWRSLGPMKTTYTERSMAVVRS